jgi:hypothetical protein
MPYEPSSDIGGRSKCTAGPVFAWNKRRLMLLPSSDTGEGERMRARTLSLAAASLALLAVLGGCAAPTRAPPAPAPLPRPLPPAPAPPPPAPPPQPEDWRDIALTPGDWSYAGDAAGSEARFGGAALGLRCDRARRQISIERAGAEPGAPIIVRTSFGSRRLAAGAALAASDALLDQMAFSRGRFTVEAAGLPMLVVPAWPEAARVIEDCRA